MPNSALVELFVTFRPAEFLDVGWEYKRRTPERRNKTAIEPTSPIATQSFPHPAGAGGQRLFLTESSVVPILRRLFSFRLVGVYRPQRSGWNYQDFLTEAG